MKQDAAQTEIWIILACVDLPQLVAEISRHANDNKKIITVAVENTSVATAT